MRNVCLKAVQIVVIHHITYQYHNHQQKTYKRISYCLLAQFTFSTIIKYNNDKTQQSYSILFYFLFCLVNRPSHEIITRKTLRSTNSGPLQIMHNGLFLDTNIKELFFFIDSKTSIISRKK